MVSPYACSAAGTASFTIPEPMERNRRNKKAPERESYATEVCSTVRRIFHSHYAKLDSVRIHTDEMKYTKLPKE